MSYITDIVLYKGINPIVYNNINLSKMLISVSEITFLISLGLF